MGSNHTQGKSSRELGSVLAAVGSILRPLRGSGRSLASPQRGYHKTIAALAHFYVSEDARVSKLVAAVAIYWPH